MTITETRRSETEGSIKERPVRAVVGWAIVGGLFAVFVAYIAVGYALSGNFGKRVGNGPDRVPTYMMVGARTLEGLFLAAFLTLAYWAVVRPLQRDRRLGRDGLFFFVGLGILWQDPLYSYTQHAFSYNTAFVNVRSWAGNIPGFMAPHPERIPYPVFTVCLGYPAFLLVVMLLGAWIMRTVKRRWPSMGNVGLLITCYLALVAIDFVFELAVMRVGWYSLGGALKGLTLFHGHYYQLPLYEPAMFAVPLTLCAALRHLRNARAHTIVERGLDSVRMRGWRLTAVRFLALLGAVNTIWLCTYEIPSMWIGLHQSAWPADIVNRSYLNPGLCGPRTTYACPGPDTPVNRPGSIHIDSQGHAVPG